VVDDEHGFDHKFELVEVTWMDAWMDQSKHHRDDWDPGCPVKTVGFLVGEDADHYHVSMDLWLNYPDEYETVLHVPKLMVREVRRLNG